MMPACMKAETGVGVSMVSGSQLWNGNWADFSAAQAVNRPQMSGSPSVCPANAALKSASNSQVPYWRWTKTTAAKRQKSPKRLTTNFFRAEKTAPVR